MDGSVCVATETTMDIIKVKIEKKHIYLTVQLYIWNMHCIIKKSSALSAYFVIEHFLQCMPLFVWQLKLKGTIY